MIANQRMHDANERMHDDNNKMHDDDDDDNEISACQHRLWCQASYR